METVAPRNARRSWPHTAYAIALSIRLLPHVLLLYVLPAKKDLRQDIQRWAENYGFERTGSTLWRFVWLMTFFPEFRNLFYRRAGRGGRLFYVLAPPMDTLFLATENIGPGLFIQHGFATIVRAKRIGANCWINQQVTIGNDTNRGSPTLEDNVTVNAGAKIIGNVTVGANSIVGANAVVVKNVPPNCTVVGVPARIVRRDGKRVDEAL
jgi:serine O-acetyltransferase